MKQEKLLFGFAGALIGFFLAWLLAPWWGSVPGYRSSMMGDGWMIDEIDAHFIEQMIPHHEDAILMADLASEKATRKEIKQLAENIMRTQSAEIKQMEDWYKDWYSKDTPGVFSGMGHSMGSGVMHGGMMGDATDIAELKMATDFDRAFIESMIPHHQMAVMMAQMLYRSTNRPEMRQLAGNIIEAQIREINSMREWHRSWYNENN